MRKSYLALSFLLLIGLVVGPAMSNGSPITLFEAIHFGHDQGNWNVGLWRHYGDGTQIAYRLTCPTCGTFYPGGPINHAGSSCVPWQGGDDTHTFELAYDPSTRSLTLTVSSTKGTPTSIAESAVSPHIDPQSHPSCPEVLYAGGEVGKVNSLRIVISATVGNNVRCVSAAPWGTKDMNVEECETTLSNLMLDGSPVTGGSADAKLSDYPDPKPDSDTKYVELAIAVPDDHSWKLTGSLTVLMSPIDGNYVPKQSRIGMTIYGEYLEAAPPVGGEWVPVNAIEMLVQIVGSAAVMSAIAALFFGFERIKRKHD